MAQQRSRAGVLLNIEDSTGRRVDAHELLHIQERSLESMDIEDMNGFVAIVTDNPSVMRKYRRLAAKKWPRILVSIRVHHCFLITHQLA
jgi:hypothetical protein